VAAWEAHAAFLLPTTKPDCPSAWASFAYALYFALAAFFRLFQPPNYVEQILRQKSLASRARTRQNIKISAYDTQQLKNANVFVGVHAL